ncbi:MAG: hypothetical protein CL693_10865 [Cellvibrionaceae bacterium]|nr:hypothetical protein [Cellvibrionaceae bacterium]
MSYHPFTLRVGNIRSFDTALESKGESGLSHLSGARIAQLLGEMVENIPTIQRLAYRSVKQAVELEPSAIVTVVVGRIERNQTTSLMILSSISDLLA